MPETEQTQKFNGIPFLTPTDQDKFVETKIGEHTYHVSFNNADNFLKVRINIPKNVITFTLLEGGQWKDEYHFKKLIGYILLKIITRYGTLIPPTDA